MWEISWMFSSWTLHTLVCPIPLLHWRCSLLPLGTARVHTSHGIGSLSNNPARWDLTVPLVSGCSEDLGGFVAFKPGIIPIHTVETVHPWGVKVVCCSWYFSLPSHCVCGNWFCCLFGVLFFLFLTMIFCLALLCFPNNTLSQSGCSAPMAR